jgi:deoxyribodipyrimidine photolyase-related protein
MAYTRIALVLGDCLFPSHEGLAPDKHTLFFMAEDAGLCTHFKYHKQKLVLFLSAMRSHADTLKAEHKLEYRALNAQNFKHSYEHKLDALLKEYTALEELVTYVIEDHFFAKRIKAWCKKNKLAYTEVDSPKFLFNTQDFEGYLNQSKKPFMQVYYKQKRKALNLLVDDNKEPAHGKWSFDEANRKKFPKNISIPPQPQSKPTQHDEDVIKLVEDLFNDHPGTTQGFNWSTTRLSALAKLNDFLKERFENFGPYEDAIKSDETYGFHSVLSPYLNMGLLTPDEVLDKALEYYHAHDTHYPSVEGFVRQIMGWREFLRGIYHNFDLDKNHFNHQRKLTAAWYQGTTGIPPLDDTIKKAQKHGYTHHIERLMVAGNLMLMAGLHPQEVYKWFMEMYVDSADWVMAPNVFGMSQFAEGGIFATKPYISGSNYLKKMSDYGQGDWCDVVDGLYWGFIDRHQETFAKNPRMGMMLATLRRMNDEKKQRIFTAAETWIEKVTTA